jgi:hypothetical protein
MFLKLGPNAIFVAPLSSSKIKISGKNRSYGDLLTSPNFLALTFGALISGGSMLGLGISLLSQKTPYFSWGVAGIVISSISLVMWIVPHIYFCVTIKVRNFSIIQKKLTFFAGYSLAVLGVQKSSFL